MRFNLWAIFLPMVVINVAAPASAREKQARDPNEVVCENQEVIGSRLAVQRVCMTRAQWAEKRRDDRAIIDRSQTQLCVAQGGVCSRGS